MIRKLSESLSPAEGDDPLVLDGSGLPRFSQMLLY